MKVANEKVWADEKGNLVPDGHADAAFLVAAQGQTVSDAHVEQYKGGSKFFKDAVFDSNAQPTKVIAPAKAPTPETFHMVDPAEARKAAKREAAADEGPAPENREAVMPKRKTRAKKAKKK